MKEGKKTEQQQHLNNGHGISIGPPKITEENDWDEQNLKIIIITRAEYNEAKEEKKSVYNNNKPTKYTQAVERKKREMDREMVCIKQMKSN